MKRLDEYFPIYKIDNFHIPVFNKKSMIRTVIDNRKYYDQVVGYNYPIKEDPRLSFKKLYHKFLRRCKKEFTFTTHESSIDTCWIYLSDKDHYIEKWHNHLLSSTINSVYYLDVPKEANVSIDFELNGKFLNHQVNNHELLIFPDYLNHKPNRGNKPGYRISVNMEIKCNETSDYVFNTVRSKWQN